MLYQILINRRFQNKGVFFSGILLITIFSSCGSYENIEFKSVDNIKISEMQGSEVTIEAVALFHNPNNIGARLKKTDIDVYLNGDKITKLMPAGKIKVGRNKDFEIPVKATLDIGKGTTINNLLQLFTKNQQEIKLKGYITIQVFLYRKQVDIDYKFPISF